MPKISVIVPIYNVEPYIKECMESLIGQTLQDIEIICVDDCGTDNSMKIVNELAQSDNRIKIVRNKQNSGLSASRNNGMKIASAKYIMFCDSDDYFDPDMCKKMYNAMQKSRAELGIFGFDIIYETNFNHKSRDDKYFAVNFDGCQDATQEIIDKNVCCACGKIYLRDIIEKHNLQFPVGLRHEDEFWYPAYCTWVKKIMFVPEKFYKYRRRVGSIMQKTFEKKTLNLDPLNIAIEYFKYMQTHNLIYAQSDWFWRNMFSRLLHATLKYSGRHNYNYCYQVANNFVDQYYDPKNTSFETQRKIAQIRNKTVMPRRIMWGVIKIKENIEVKKIEFLGICIWKKKYK